MIPFFAIYAKGGESMSPKQKDRTTTNLKILVFQLVLILERVFQLVWFSIDKFQIGILLCSKGGEK